VCRFSDDDDRINVGPYRTVTMFGTGLRYPLSFYLLVILCLVAAIASLIPAIKLRLRYLIGIVGNLEYDVCVLTGDYRGKTYGPFKKSLEIISELRAQLNGPIFAVLGNHDSIHMAPPLEAMGIRMMFNECEPIVRQGQRIFLSGVDDPHFYRADDIEKAASQIPSDAFSVLLAHTPEVYDRAARAGFNLMLSGHTHGGQLCLPGGVAIKLEAVLSRSRPSSAVAKRLE